MNFGYGCHKEILWIVFNQNIFLLGVVISLDFYQI